jgi:hypothetical protein
MKIIPLSMKCIAGGTQPEVSTTRENTTERMLGGDTQKKSCTAENTDWKNARLEKYAANRST